jgi:hypothetical protein
MKSTVTEKAEKIKTIIGDTALKSKEAVQEIININNKILREALDSNKVMVKEIRDQFHIDGKSTPSLDSFNKAFGKAVELSEETIDTIIEGYNKQIQMYVDYNTKLIDTMKESAVFTGKNKEMDRFLQLIQDNFEASVNTMNTNMKAVIESYNKHTNLALNFRQKFGDTVTAQLGMYSELQKNGIEVINSWASEWWKHTDHK